MTKIEENKNCYHCGLPLLKPIFHTQNCPALSSPDPLASIAESLERLADIAELTIRRETTDYGNSMSIKDLLRDTCVVITPKAGDN